MEYSYEDSEGWRTMRTRGRWRLLGACFAGAVSEAWLEIWLLVIILVSLIVFIMALCKLMSLFFGFLAVRVPITFNSK